MTSTEGFWKQSIPCVIQLFCGYRYSLCCSCIIGLSDFTSILPFSLCGQPPSDSPIRTLKVVFRAYLTTLEALIYRSLISL